MLQILRVDSPRQTQSDNNSFATYRIMMQNKYTFLNNNENWNNCFRVINPQFFE